MSDTQAIERLADVEKALDHPDDRTRFAVLELLAQHPQQALALTAQGRDVIDVIVERLKREGATAVRTAMLMTLTAFGSDARIRERMIHEAQHAHGTYEHMLSLGYLAQHDPEAARPFAKRLLFSKHRDQIRVAAKMLGDVHDLTPFERVRMHVTYPAPILHAWDAAHLDALVDELQGPMQVGARELVEHHHPEVARDLFARWPSLDDETRAWYVDAIRDDLDVRFVADALRAALQEPASRAARHALEVLARRGCEAFGVDAAAIEPARTVSDEHEALVIRASASPADAADLARDATAKPLLRAAALRRLARLDASALDAGDLAVLLGDRDWRVRAGAAEVLAHRSDVEGWLDAHWRDLGDDAHVAVSRALLDRNQDDVLERHLAGASSR